MNKKMKQICNEILGGNQSEENIPVLLNHMANQYHTYAGVGLAMHYYAFYETYVDEEGTWSSAVNKMVEQLNIMIKKYLIQQQVDSLDDDIIKIDGMRKDVMNRMKVLTTYTDMFQLYEYVLNRVEYRFTEERPILDEEEMAREILRYIFDSSDNFVINEKIKEIIGQLPIRMTKQKFFDYLEDSLRLYLGSEKSTLDSYVYMLKTSATLEVEDGMEALYPILWENRKKLSGYNYKEMTDEIYRDALETLKLSTLILESETTIYYNLQEIINEVYAMLLTTSYAGIGEYYMSEQEEAIQGILTCISSCFENSNKEDLPLELMDQFAVLEGVQEELMEEIIHFEEPLYEIDRNGRALAKSIMSDKMLNALLLSKDLLSNSIFIDFDEVKDITTVDEEILKQTITELTTSYKEYFSTTDKRIIRAIMANSLNKMPVFFQSHNDVMDYVLYSLQHCTDQYEKLASVEIIKGIMAE